MMRVTLYWFFIFSVVSKKRSTHLPYTRQAQVAFHFVTCISTQGLSQIDKPDTNCEFLKI